MDGIVFTILVFVIYVILIAFYPFLLFFTKKKAEMMEQKQHHYILNLISMVILLVSLMTPINTWLGYGVACVLLMVELVANRFLRKRKIK